MKQMRTSSDRIGLELAYSDANSTLPDTIPYITKAEALRAYKKLVRKFGVKEKKSLYRDEFVKVKKAIRTYNRPRKVWICLSGCSGTLHKGWRRLIHDVAHEIFRWRSPGLPDHCKHQADFETEIVKHVLKSGWLNGTLKSKPKPKLSSDEKISIKIKRLQDNIKHWETKLKRTNTYLKSYKGKLKRYKKLYPHL